MPDSGDKKLTAPKFASFKPKALNPVTTSDIAREQKGEKDDTGRERRPRHDSRHRDDRPKHRSEHRSERRPEHRLEHRSEHRHRDRKRSRSRSPQRSAIPDKTVAVPGPDDRVGNGLFIIDKKGDPLIRRYGGNDRARVPLYHRGGRGRVLGSDGFLCIHRDGPHEQFSIRQPGEGASNLRGRALFQTGVHRAKTKRIRVLNERPKNELEHTEQDFVPLGPPSKQRRLEEPDTSGNETPSYRSIEGKAKAHEFSDSDLDYDSQDNEMYQDAEEPLKQRSIQLSRRVKEHPDDIGGWLELIAHQDVLLRAGESLNRDATKGEVHSFAEIKISMYESALAKAKTPEDEERLLLGLMLEGAQVWSPSKLDSKWEEVSKKHESSFCLWKAKMDHKLASLTTFQYSNVKDLHTGRLRAVAKQPAASVSSEPGFGTNNNDISRYEQMIYVFLRATRFVYDAGYRELAVAAWQAFLELNLHRPAECDAMSEPQILNAFRDFWEDEVARIGEPNALGWSHYAQARGEVEPPEPRKDDDTITPSRDVYKSWGATETSRAANSRVPGRATDDVLEDDPYRVVMFSDIEELLFVIPTGAVSTLREQLVDGLLLFCSLPPAFCSSPWIEAAENDPLIVGGMNVFERDVLQPPNQPDIMDETKKSPSFKQDGLRLAISTDLLFGGPDWFSVLSGWASTSGDLGGPVDLTWIANALRQLTTRAFLRDLAEYSLALDMLHGPEAIKKRAKSLIKQDPRNLRLYTAYAMAESASGNVKVGQQVVSSATGLTLPLNHGQWSALWKTWAWMELQAGNKLQAVVRLCAAADESLRNTPGVMDVTPMQLLKAQQMFQDNLEHQFSTRQLDDAILSSECLALLMYLTAQENSEPTSAAQGSISVAMERIWTVSSELSAQGQGRSRPHEKLLQSGARLLYHHASRGPFRRAYLREQLAHCIQLFPRNSMFLTLFSWASTTFGIDDPVRSILHRVTLTNANDCISSRMFAIRYELLRGNVHSTQAAFERALESSACKFNPHFWRCYIRFSYARQQFRPKAKDVFFRGLRYCPWSKDLALEAFTTLINVMDEFELRSVFNTMTSKGLRIHVDLEEFVAKQVKSKPRRH